MFTEIIQKQRTKGKQREIQKLFWKGKNKYFGTMYTRRAQEGLKQTSNV